MKPRDLWQSSSVGRILKYAFIALHRDFLSECLPHKSDKAMHVLLKVQTKVEYGLHEEPIYRGQGGRHPPVNVDGALLLSNFISSWSESRCYLGHRSWKQHLSKEIDYGRNKNDGQNGGHDCFHGIDGKRQCCIAIGTAATMSITRKEQANGNVTGQILIDFHWRWKNCDEERCYRVNEG